VLEVMRDFTQKDPLHKTALPFIRIPPATEHHMSKDPAYLSILQDYYAEHGVFPPYSGIGQLLGLRSKSSVAAFVARMRADGRLEATPDRRLKPGVRFFERTTRGTVRAGLPQVAEDDYLDPVSLDRYLIDTPSRTLLVEVKGDSMNGAGILSGDLAVVERGAHAELGDLVVARVDGEFTLKRLGRDGEHPTLIPANPDYPVIHAEGELEIVGRVRGVVRKYTK
jgi:repressor LexA